MSDESPGADATITTFLEQTRFVHVVRFGLQGGIVSANAAMASRLGVAEEALKGRAILDCLTVHDAALVSRWLATGSPDPGPVQLNFCDADTLPFTLLCFVSVQHDGFLMIGEPVYGDEQRLQQQLLQTNQELANLARNRHRSTLEADRARAQAESENRAKDEALAVIAHELRQPLSGVVAALAVMKHHPAGAERAREILERQIGQITRLVEDLLQASQIMRGAIELERAPTDLRQVVREAADLTEATTRERRQQMTVRMDDQPLPVLADTSRIRQVLTNIMTNAAKYTPEGGSIFVVAEHTADGTGQVRVRDTGQGIDAADIDRVFELFVRATRGGDGLGIGLAVARRLVELHDGTITVSSEGAGLGSEFTVTLPVIRPA
jgi:signal transduction histidine kinase